MIYPHFSTPKAYTFFVFPMKLIMINNNRLQQEALLIFTTTTRLDVSIAQFNLNCQCHALCNLFNVISNSHGSVSWFKTLLSAMKPFPCSLLLRMARMDIWIKT